MTWFRTNTRTGSRLALMALALQLVLSFGHSHGIAAPNAIAAQAMSAIGPVQPASDHEPDSAVDLCAICAVTAMASTALFATPPALPLLQSAAFRYLTAATGLFDPASTRAAFQPRAPPAS
jgi:hypothetical protein